MVTVHGQLVTFLYLHRWRCWWLEMTARCRPAAWWGAVALQAPCLCTRLQARQQQLGDDLATVLAKARATAQSVGSMGVAHISLHSSRQQAR